MTLSRTQIRSSSRAPHLSSVQTDVLIAALVLAFTAVPIQVQPLDPQVLRDAFRNQSNLLDVVANLLGYIPLGLALNYRGTARALTFAFALSVFAEITQVFCVDRSPGIVDVATNTFGAAIGLLIARKWQVLPERLVVSRTVAVFAAIAATSYVALGGGQTVEGFLDELSITLKASPWRPTNPRGVSSAGALEASWAFDTVDRGRVADDSGNGLHGTLVNGAALSSGRLRLGGGSERFAVGRFRTPDFAAARRQHDAQRLGQRERVPRGRRRNRIEPRRG